jgi:hypothetical protein
VHHKPHVRPYACCTYMRTSVLGNHAVFRLGQDVSAHGDEELAFVLVSSLSKAQAREFLFFVAGQRYDARGTRSTTHKWD